MPLSHQIRIKKTTAVPLLLICAILSGPLFASFEDLPVGARAAGMAGAYAAAADDTLSLYYNPAGLARVRRPELSATLSRLFWGLDDGSNLGRQFVGYAHPLSGDSGVLGVSYVHQGLSSLYSENTYGLSYGRVWGDWNFGGTIKSIGKKFGSDSYSSNAVDSSGVSLGVPDAGAAGKSKNATAVDLGAQYNVTSHYILAAAWRNINQPNVAVSGSDKAPSAFSLAVERWTRIAALSFQITEAQYNGRWDQNFALGGERWFFNGMGLRAGLGTGTRSAHRFSVGLGFRREPIQVDYAIDYPLGNLTTFGSHLISFSVRFGPPPMDPLELKVDQERKARLKAEDEIADLKKKIQALLEKSGMPAPPKPILPPLPAKVEEAKPAAPPKPAKPSVSAKDLMEYTEALKFYAYQVKSGVAVDQRVGTLQSILEKFQNKNIDMAAVRRELSRLQDENKKVAEDYKLAEAYYQKIVQTGISSDERAILLDRIIKKYKPFGLDTSVLEGELNSLRK